MHELAIYNLAYTVCIALKLVVDVLENSTVTSSHINFIFYLIESWLQCVVICPLYIYALFFSY